QVIAGEEEIPPRHFAARLQPRRIERLVIVVDDVAEENRAALIDEQRDCGDDPGYANYAGRCSGLRRLHSPATRARATRIHPTSARLRDIARSRSTARVSPLRPQIRNSSTADALSLHRAHEGAPDRGAHHQGKSRL